MMKTGEFMFTVAIAVSIAAMPVAAQRTERTHQAEWLTITRAEWHRAGIAVLTFTIRNDSDWTASDIDIECLAEGRSGTTISTVRNTIFDKIAAHSTRTLDFALGHVHPQSHTFSCLVVGVRL
jgi:hypothetical protein